MTKLLTIGEFSRASGMTVKALRFYHEQELLVPVRVEVGTGYRFYAIDQLEQARVISTLRELQFSVKEIVAITAEVTDEVQLLQYLDNKRSDIESRMKRDRSTLQAIRSLTANIQESKVMSIATSRDIEEKSVDSIHIAAYRMHAPYAECGDGFKKLGRAFGRHICGKGLLLCHDSEYKEIANYEVCLPIRKGSSTDEFDVRELPAVRCVTYQHVGPYDLISKGYAKVTEYIKSNDLSVKGPTREVYLRGPGMLFRGNPQKYVTEIQFPIG